MTTASSSATSSPAVSRLDKIQKWLSFSKSIYAIIAAIAAVIIANQTEARRTRFVIYVISQLWIECALVVALWLLYIWVRKLLSKLGATGWKFKVGDVLRPSTGMLVLVDIAMLIALVPPFVYIVRMRYAFWTSQILGAYVEAAKTQVDKQAAAGALYSAHATAENVSDILRGTAKEGRLDYRRKVLEAAIQRSESLDKASMTQWNPVTERVVFFSLVESVRINPENFSANDRLGQKLSTVTTFLTEDAKAICGSQGKLEGFSGKAVANIEARSLWQRFGSADQCAEHVTNDLRDGWGIAAITCIGDRSNILKSRGAVDARRKDCPDGDDFWTPVTASESGGEEGASSYDHPVYPTVLDLWWRVKRLVHSRPEEK